MTPAASYAGLSYGDCVGDECAIYEAASGFGPGIVAGVGYDIRIGRNKSLTPELTFAKGFSRDLSDHGRRVGSGWTHDVWAFNVCLTFH